MRSPVQKIDLTSGSIPRHLVRMTVPMIWGILAIVSFQLVDAYYISRLGTAHMAAFSYTFPITYGIFSIFIGFGIAMSSVISRLIGAGKHEDVKRVTSHGILLVMLVSALIGLLGIPLLDPLFTMLGADAESLPLIHSFMTTYFLGTFFVSMPVVGNAALRASGDATLPAIIMTTAALLNALINPVLIFGLFGFPRMEMFGAALGTVFANFGAMVAGLTVMYRKGLFDFAHLRTLADFGDSAKRLLVIAIPAGLTSMLPSVVSSVILYLLSGIGPESEGAVAAFGAASRIEAFMTVILMALSIGMAPIIGQNFGAGYLDRVRETIKYAIGFCVVWSLLSGLCLTLGASALATEFAGNSDSSFYTYLHLYFIIIPLSYTFGNIVHGWGSSFNAIGKPQISAGMLFIKTLCVMVPAAILGRYIAGATGIFVAIATVNVISGATIHLWSRRQFLSY